MPQRATCNLSLGPGCRSEPKCGSFARPPNESDVKTIGIKFRDLLRLQLSVCTCIYKCSHRRTLSTYVLSHPHSPSHAKFIPSSSINLLSAYRKGVGGESSGKKSQSAPFDAVIRLCLAHIMSQGQMMERFVRVDTVIGGGF